MKTWSVSNQKGGVGKTTTVVTLGGLLSSWGFRTLLVDLDPHGSLTSYFKMNPDEVEFGVYNLFRDAGEKKKNIDPQLYIAPTEFDGLSILPASTAIATLDRQVAQMSGMGLVISNALAKVANQYDYAIIDSPPMLGVLMINALAACDQLIVPVLAEFLALKGLERMVHTLNMVFNSRKTAPRYLIVPTLYDKRTKAARDSLVALHQQYPHNVWDSVIPVDTRVREASRVGVPLPLFDKTAKSVEAYSRLLELLLLDKTGDNLLTPQIMKANTLKPRIVQQQLALDMYLSTLLEEVPEAHENEVLLPVAKVIDLVSPHGEAIEVVALDNRALIRTTQPVIEPEPARPKQEPESKYPLPSVMPEWAQQEFQALFFKVEHMILATPLCELSRTIKLDRKMGKIPGQPTWFMGLLDDQDSRIGVLDTGQLVFGKQRGRQRDHENHPFKQILITEDKRWGLACDEILSIGRLQPEKVRWRTLRQNKPWLIGTIIDELTAIIDLRMLVPHRKHSHQTS